MVRVIEVCVEPLYGKETYVYYRVGRKYDEKYIVKTIQIDSNDRYVHLELEEDCEFSYAKPTKWVTKESSTWEERMEENRMKHE